MFDTWDESKWVVVVIWASSSPHNECLLTHIFAYAWKSLLRIANIQHIFWRYQTYHLFRLEKAKEESIIITFPELFFSENRVSILFFVSDIWGNWQLSFFFYCITIYVQRQKRNFHHYMAHSKIRGILQCLVRKKTGLNLVRDLFFQKKKDRAIYCKITYPFG